MVFMSRSAHETGKHDALVSELAALGCSPILVSGSISNEDDVMRSFGAARKPIRGVVHMSMVLNVRLGSLHLFFRDLQLLSGRTRH